MKDEALIKKLKLKPEYQVLVLNAPELYLNRLGDTAYTIEAGKEPAYDFVHLFVKDKAALAQWGKVAVDSLKPDAVLWISYPKISSKIKTDITRDRGWEVITAAGLEGVAQIAIDDTWSALRFRPSVLVKRSTDTVTANGELTVPEDFVQALDAAPNAKSLFEKLSFTHRKEYIRWIATAKKQETRSGRIVKAVAMLSEGIKNP